jgi:NADH-quinone oxidoreductase subunit N
MFLNILQNFSVELGLVAIILGLLILDILFKKDSHARRKQLGSWSIALVAVLLVIHFFSWGNLGSFLFGTFIQDKLSYFFKGFFLLAALFVLLMSREYSIQLERGHSEFYLLILLSTLGMITLSSAQDFILLFVSLELVTISFYIMTTYLRTDPKSIEAGLKYLVLGALSSGFLLYGISFIYGITGSTQFDAIAQYPLDNPMTSKGLLFGFLLVIAGIGFKIASVPFHLWVPDVYEGAPTPITAFLSVGSKAAGLVILIRLIVIIFPNFESQCILLLSVLSAMTLIYGNLGAIPQKNIKRFLGYSSIGHAGYLLMGYAAGSSLGLSAVLYYILSYLFTNLGAFLIIVIFFNATKSDDMAEYSGLSQRSPFLAGSMLIALMSLAGIPPLAGFFGKFLLISAAVQSGLVWLAIIGAINVIISLYYYLVIVKRMYIQEPTVSTSIPVSLPMRVGIIASLIGMIGLGIYQEPVLKLASIAVKGFF